MENTFSDLDIDYLITAVDKASSAVIKIYQDPQFDTWQKDDASPLTSADLISNEILVNALVNRWPEIPVLSEELLNIFVEGESPSAYWAIDPIDGTKEFIKRNGEFTINVALIVDGKPRLGLLAAPALSLLFIGLVGSGAKERDAGNWKNLEPIQSVNIHDTSKPISVAVSRSHPSTELNEWLTKFSQHTQVAMGSSLKFCLIAQGKVDCYPRFGPTCLWDTAAADAILRSLGGGIYQWNQNADPVELDYSQPKNYLNPSFIAY